MVLSMDRWVGKVAVVTGASSGIGVAIAEQLVENGVKVVALARRQDRLDQLAKKLAGKKGKLFPIKTDLLKEEDILKAFTWTEKNLGPIHILINNAGAAERGSIINSDTEVWNRILQLNVTALCVATREAVKNMRANNVDGHIIHVNSIVGHQVPHVQENVYPATKFAVRALAETLRLELNSLKLKIKITNLSPGLIDTEFHAPDIRQRTKKLYEDAMIIDAEQIADGAIYALSTPPHTQVQELIIRPIMDLV